MLNFNSGDYPCLRRLDARPIMQQGRQYIVLQDPLELTRKQLLIPQPIAPILALCNGKRPVDEICALFHQQSDIAIQPTQFREMLAALDNAFMLENEHYESMAAEARRVYRSRPCRHPMLAGQAYSADAEQLAKELDGYMGHQRGNQGAEYQPFGYASGYSVGFSADYPASHSPGSSVTHQCRGLLSPHIDYARGGEIYGQVWKEAAAAAKEADLVILIGTDHNGTDPFTLTQQNYATPYGTLPTPKPIIDTLAETIDGFLGNGAAYAGELRHCREHSLELVATWLHHIRHGQPCQLVPILVGGFHSFLRDESCPKDDPLITAVLEKLYESTQGKNVLVVASGDMAHVGPAFGGKPLQQAGRRTLRRDDERLLTQMQAGDTEQFFEEIRQVEDGNNVCGVSPIYLTMRLLEMMDGPIRATVTGYQTCPADEFETSVVTIGGVIFH